MGLAPPGTRPDIRAPASLRRTLHGACAWGQMPVRTKGVSAGWISGRSCASNRQAAQCPADGNARTADEHDGSRTRRDARHQRCRQVDRQAARLRRVLGPVQRDRHPALGAGDGLCQSDALGPGVRRASRSSAASSRRNRFTVAMDYGHGCHPACVGKIPGSHLIFARRGVVVLRDADPPRRQAGPGAPLRTATRSPTPAFAGPTMFAAATRCTATSTVRWSPRSARPRSAIWSRKPTSARSTTRTTRPPKLLDQERTRRDRRGFGHDWILSNREGRFAPLRRREGRRQAAAPGDRPALAW